MGKVRPANDGCGKGEGGKRASDTVIWNYAPEHARG